jgi:thiol-disulfide isomerase/thioredoxin
LKKLVFIFLFYPGFLLSQEVTKLTFDSLEKYYSTGNDTLYVVNFWATWCKPCVEELPYFDSCAVYFESEKVKIFLVNLDFHSKVETVVKPFMERRKILSKVFHITDKDPNDWINKVDSTWSGAIPATIFLKKRNNLFFREGAFTLEELKNLTERFLKK